MRRTVILVGILCLVCLAYVGTNADAFVLINEILADPPSIGGDANRDGVISSTNDEFVELVNTSSNIVDLSGWWISDATKTRHVFPVDSLLNPESFFVVFGGGAPDLPGVQTQKSSTGALSLNNTVDTITLYDPTGTVVDQVVYGTEGDKDNSLTRLTDGMPTAFVLHSQHPLSQSLKFSPGTTVDGHLQLASPSAVPEPGTFALLSSGFLLMMARRKTERL